MNESERTAPLSTETTLTPETMIPATEPVAVKSKKTRKKRAKKAGKANQTTKANSNDLIPDLDKLSGSVEHQYTYWIGVTESCPTNHLDVGSIAFPKTMEELVPDPARPGSYQRIPRFGSLHELRKDQVDSIIRGCKHGVVRFTSKEPGKEKGYPIRIPTDEQLELSRQHGRGVRAYVQQPNDEPIAQYIYAVLCEDQDNPRRGEYSPAPLSETGLDWPNE
tara:strand:- start:390 stop:1052 length:663 start_codon:yes stop_codon:yes gene_type:complete